jgi:hypothetical protein
MAEGNGGDIIITGGSIDLEFDPNVYVKDPGNPKKHSANKKIVKIQVLDERGVEQYSREDESGLKWVIKVTGKS